LIGRAIASSPKNSRMNIFWIIFFSIIPDLPVAITYLYLGILNSRPFGIALDSDWVGFKQIHNIFSSLYNTTHSFLFAIFLITPVIKYFKLPKIALLAYCLHIFSDLFTHSGEWSIKPFYPLQYRVEGFSNVWAWPFWEMAVSWTVLLIIILLLDVYHKHLK
jgi:hypothetical protein